MRYGLFRLKQALGGYRSEVIKSDVFELVGSSSLLSLSRLDSWCSGCVVKNIIGSNLGIRSSAFDQREVDVPFGS